MERFDDIAQQDGDSWGPLKMRKNGKTELYWFVLNPFFGLMCYYANQYSKVPLGALLMSQYSMEVINAEPKKTGESGGLFNFLFEPWDSEFKLTHKVEGHEIYIISKNIKSREGWISAIQSLYEKDNQLPLLRPPTRAAEEEDTRDVVAIIPIEDKYLMTSPTKVDLDRRHEGLKSQLKTEFPAVGAVVLQQWNSADKQKKRGVGTWHYGNLEVHQTLSPDTASLLHLSAPSGKMSDPEYIPSPPSLFSVLKSLHFAVKLNIFKKLMENESSTDSDRCHADRPTPLGLTITALLSDIVDEILCIPDRKLEQGEGFDPQRLKKLCQLGDFLVTLLGKRATPDERFNSTEGLATLEIGVHIHNMVNPGGQLQYAVRAIWHRIRTALAGAVVSEPSSAFTEAIRKRRAEWAKRTDDRPLLMQYSLPSFANKKLITNCQLLRAQQVSGRRGETMLHRGPEKVIRSVVERGNIFVNSDDRKAAMASLQAKGSLSGQVGLVSA